jgi:tetratricopeptide (TPR) repeat protein
MYFEHKRYDEAAALFESAVAIKENSLGPEHPVVGRILSDVAANDLARGYYAEAASPCQRALSILEKTSPLDYPALVDALDNYAWLLRKTNRKAAAELLETRAMVYRAKLRQNKKKN